MWLYKNKIISKKYAIFNILNVQIRGITLYDCLNNSNNNGPGKSNRLFTKLSLSSIGVLFKYANNNLFII